MLIIEGKNLWFQLIYDEDITEQEFLDSLQTFYEYAKQNPKQVTKLVNEHGNVLDSKRFSVNLSNLGF